MRFQTFEQTASNDILNDTLKIIGVEFSTKCDRKCSFCPQSFHNFGKNFMTTKTLYDIIDFINNSNYNNRICISNRGENTLHPKWLSFICILRTYLKKNHIMLITNGDYINDNDIKILKNIENFTLRISIYDNISKYEHLTKHDWVEYRVVDNIQKEFFNDRNTGIGINKKCFTSSYKFDIYYNGDINPCADMWIYDKPFSTIYDNNLYEFWVEKCKQFRLNCYDNRQLNKQCKHCNTNGTLYGKFESNIFKEYYEKTKLESSKR